MSDDIEISQSGLVAVDTDSLREASRACAALAADAEPLGAALQRASARPPLIVPHYGAAGAEGALVEVRRARDEADELAAGLLRAAALYDAVELEARWHAAGAPAAYGFGRAALARLREAGVLGADHEASDALAYLARNREAHRARADALLASQSGISALGAAAAAHLGWGWFGPLLARGLAGAQGAIRTLGDGRVADGTALRGTPPPTYAPEPVVTRGAAPPGGVGAAIGRIPGGDDGTVRIDEMVLPDGTREWALYIGGTQSVGLTDGEAFDMHSNARLYAGLDAASAELVAHAIREAGIPPGEAVHVAGFSQGAMIGAYVAAAGDLDVKSVVGAGQPMIAELGPGVLSVDLRHTDDPVAALSGAGRDTVNGHADSVQVRRTVDPMPGLHDLGMPAHSQEQYRQTAALFEASGDPRAQPVQAVYDRWADATVTSYEFRGTQAPLLGGDRGDRDEAPVGSPISRESAGGG